MCWKARRHRRRGQRRLARSCRADQGHRPSRSLPGCSSAGQRVPLAILGCEDSPRPGVTTQQHPTSRWHQPINPQRSHVAATSDPCVQRLTEPCPPGRRRTSPHHHRSRHDGHRGETHRSSARPVRARRWKPGRQVTPRSRRRLATRQPDRDAQPIGQTPSDATIGEPRRQRRTSRRDQARHHRRRAGGNNHQLQPGTGRLDPLPNHHNAPIGTRNP